MSDGITIHPRYFIVRKAAGELNEAMAKILKTHGLTFGEITSILAEEILIWNKYAIRHERHPDDSEKKGDEA
jgi:hypothetical protein